MGYMRHRAMIVTSWNREDILIAHKRAVEIYHRKNMISDVCPVQVNGYSSFAIFPDGSKLGWEDSDRSNSDRHNFIYWLRCQAGQNKWFDWVEVQFGDDERVTKICAHSDEERVYENNRSVF